ncbi:DoxX family membrane protein [Haloferax namakaokahaiae]|uniref:DoxX family membrane protein n=1 Tax=Haloferax namakaokahaiae TaxID=1748331 RepID=A0ABD5ZJK6_9EURY
MTTNAQVEMLGRQIEFNYAEGVTGYVLVLVRLLTGYWFLHAGVTKYLGAEPFNAAGWMTGATQGTLVHGLLAWVAGVPVLMELTNFMIPLGEVLIGLGILVGALTRLAAFFGGFLMVFFYLGNADFAHGFVNGDLFGLMLFAIVGTLALGRIYGVDAIVEKTEFVRQRPALKYILG